jgi:hypothetical protein
MSTRNGSRLSVPGASLPRVQTIGASEALLGAGGDDPLLAYLLAWRVVDSPAYRLGDAVLFCYDYWGDAGCLVMGPADACAQLLTQVADEVVHAGHVSVPEESLPLLLPGLFEPDEAWRFRWTDRRPAAPSRLAGWLGDSDHADIQELLDEGFADASMRPGDPRARRWAGIRADDGRLIACAADCSGSGVGFMASVTSRLSARGSGAGLAVTCWLTHALLDDYRRVGLFQYDDNAAATAVYDRLGFDSNDAYVAGRLLPP